MSNSVNHLVGSLVNATDGSIGTVRAVYFDDRVWAIRYLVVDTGDWLPGRKVLISPYSVMQPVGAVKNVDLALTRQQVRDSPRIDTEKPVLRQHEAVHIRYYGHPEYWVGGEMWGLDPYPVLPKWPGDHAPIALVEEVRIEGVLTQPSALHSNEDVKGYHVEARDGYIGHIEDFLFDVRAWNIQELVMDTSNWWPAGKRVRIAIDRVAGVDGSARRMKIDLSREQVKSCPDYTPEY